MRTFVDLDFYRYPQPTPARYLKTCPEMTSFLFMDFIRLCISRVSDSLIKSSGENIRRGGLATQFADSRTIKYLATLSASCYPRINKICLQFIVMECNGLFLQHLMLSCSIKDIVAGDTNQLTFAIDRYLEPVIGY